MNDYYLGIDIGSVSISLVVIDDHNRINYSAYAFHNGRLSENLRKILKEINIGQVKGIGYTSSTPPILSVGNKVDTRVSYISAVKYFHPEARSLLIIGAEKFGRVTFFENREYRNYKSNSSCAAGTGNFLDQQAERLNISDIKEFSNLAIQNKGSFPKIASRCAVFAKTDLIHAQQEGYSLGEICDGLSYGVAKNIVDTVFHDHSFDNVVAAKDFMKINL